MKIILYTLVSLLLFLSSCVSNAKDSEEKNTTAQTFTKDDFEEFNVVDDFDENPFDWFKGQGLLLAVGTPEHNNAMTIGWGSLGNVWGKIGASTVTVYVAEARYTFEFMEKYNYFTVMAFEKKDYEILRYMGSHSGRDGNKAEHLGLHTLYTENGTPYYAEASIVLECQTIYRAPFEKEGMCQAAQEFYDNFNAGIHHIYIGNVVKALKRKADD